MKILFILLLFCSCATKRTPTTYQIDYRVKDLILGVDAEILFKESTKK